MGLAAQTDEPKYDNEYLCKPQTLGTCSICNESVGVHYNNGTLFYALVSDSKKPVKELGHWAITFKDQDWSKELMKGATYMLPGVYDLWAKNLSYTYAEVGPDDIPALTKAVDEGVWTNATDATGVSLENAMEDAKKMESFLMKMMQQEGLDLSEEGMRVYFENTMKDAAENPA